MITLDRFIVYLVFQTWDLPFHL